MKLELPKEKVFPMPFRFWVIVAVALVILVVNGWHPVLFPLVMFGFWGITACRNIIELEADFCAVGLILCEYPFDGFSCFGGVHRRRNPDREFQ